MWSINSKMARRWIFCSTWYEGRCYKELSWTTRDDVQMRWLDAVTDTVELARYGWSLNSLHVSDRTLTIHHELPLHLDSEYSVLYATLDTVSWTVLLDEGCVDTWIGLLCFVRIVFILATGRIRLTETTWSRLAHITQLLRQLGGRIKEGHKLPWIICKALSNSTIPLIVPRSNKQ